jgi:hypothetical protein
VLVKSDAIFECSVPASYPPAQFSWRKNNKRLNENNKKFKITHDSNWSVLRVTDVNHAINVTCVAESVQQQGGWRHEATATLSVIPEKDKPRQLLPLIRISNPKSVEPSHLFRIDCNVTSPGTPLTSLVWYQSNRPISFENSKYSTNSTRLEGTGNWDR